MNLAVLPMNDIDFIKQYAKGEVELGLQWGSPTIDRHWLWKKNFTIILGHSGIGKTKLTLYMELSAAMRYGHKMLVYTSEDYSAVVKMELIECMAGKKIRWNDRQEMSDDEIKFYYEQLEKYSIFIRNDKVYSWGDLRGIIEHTMQKVSNIKSIIIDPYNSLRVDKEVLGQLSTHDYHYEVASEMRVKQQEWGVRLVVNMHPATEAARRVIKENGHPYNGYADFPRASDAEQGAKWKNRADDFIIFHRLYNHPSDSNTIFVKVDKIKSVFTGGKPTIHDSENFGLRVMWNWRDNRFLFEGIDILNNEKYNCTEQNSDLVFAQGEQIQDEQQQLVDDLPF